MEATPEIIQLAVALVLIPTVGLLVDTLFFGGWK